MQPSGNRDSACAAWPVNSRPTISAGIRPAGAPSRRFGLFAADICPVRSMSLDATEWGALEPTRSLDSSQENCGPRTTETPVRLRSGFDGLNGGVHPSPKGRVADPGLEPGEAGWGVRVNGWKRRTRRRDRRQEPETLDFSALCALTSPGGADTYRPLFGRR